MFKKPENPNSKIGTTNNTSAHGRGTVPYDTT